MLEFKQIVLCKYNILIIFVLGGLIVSSKAMAQEPQRCTTDPFSHEILPLCGPGGDGGGTTIGPEDLLDFTQSSNGSWRVTDISQLVGIQVLGAPPSALQVGSEYHVFVPNASNGHLHGQWQTSDLSQTATNGTSFGLVSQPFALLDGNNFHVYTPGSGGHLYDFFKQPNANWVATDVSAITGPSLLGIGAASFRDATSGEFHVFENGTPASPQSTQPSACQLSLQFWEPVTN
jgi:hypothetical protein